MSSEYSLVINNNFNDNNNNTSDNECWCCRCVFEICVLSSTCVYVTCVYCGQLISSTINDNRYTHARMHDTRSSTGVRRQSMAHAFYYYVSTVAVFFFYILCAARFNNISHKTQFGFTGGGGGDGGCDKPCWQPSLSTRHHRQPPMYVYFIYNVKTYYDSHLFMRRAGERSDEIWFYLRVSDFPRKKTYINMVPTSKTKDVSRVNIIQIDTLRTHQCRVQI